MRLTTGPTGQPPFWRWFEPPRWWPAWLHVRTCTYCRDFPAALEDQ